MRTHVECSICKAALSLGICIRCTVAGGKKVKKRKKIRKNGASYKILAYESDWQGTSILYKLHKRIRWKVDERLFLAGSMHVVTAHLMNLIDSHLLTYSSNIQYLKYMNYWGLVSALASARLFDLKVASSRPSAAIINPCPDFFPSMPSVD